MFTCTEPLVGGDGKIVPCGASLDEVIKAIPEDGKEHSYDCQRCGRKHRAMRYPPAPAKTEEVEAK